MAEKTARCKIRLGCPPRAEGVAMNLLGLNFLEWCVSNHPSGRAMLSWGEGQWRCSFSSLVKNPKSHTLFGDSVIRNLMSILRSIIFRNDVKTLRASRLTRYCCESCDFVPDCIHSQLEFNTHQFLGGVTGFLVHRKQDWLTKGPKLHTGAAFDRSRCTWGIWWRGLEHARRDNAAFSIAPCIQ